jgi:hypothetical protein
MRGDFGPKSAIAPHSDRSNSNRRLPADPKDINKPFFDKRLQAQNVFGRTAYQQAKHPTGA